MTKISFFAYLLIMPSLVVVKKDAVAQENDELSKRKGFKGIRLESPVSDLKGAKFKKTIWDNGKGKDKFLAKVYTINHSNYKKVGEVKIKKIEVKSYKELVYEIDVIAEKDERLMKAMEKLYGKPTFNIRYNWYVWSSNTVNLTFESFSKGKVKLTYKSPPMYDMIRQDKSEKINGITDDL